MRMKTGVKQMCKFSGTKNFFKTPKASRRHKGNMVVTIIIFMLSFLVFCICAIDAGHVVVSRYKVQKVTETVALYMASYLNSRPTEERTKDTLEPLKERFEDLYSSSLSGFYNFRITNIELKNETTEPKVKISTEANIPTLFLKYAGIGVIKILQVSYAKAETSDMTMIDSDANSYTYEAGDIITDKNGNDISVKYDGDYFIFAGLKGHDDEIIWSDLSYATDGTKKAFDIALDLDTEHRLGCMEKGTGTAFYDFSRTDEKTIGLVKYIKIYKADCSKEITPPEGSAGEGEEASGKDSGGTGEGTLESPAGEETAELTTEEGGSGETTGDETTGETSDDITPTDDKEGSTGEEEGGESTSTPEVKVLNSVRLIRKSQF